MVWNLQSEMRSAGLPAPLAGCAEPLEHHGNAQKTLDTDFTNILGFRLCAMGVWEWGSQPHSSHASRKVFLSHS